VPLMDSYSDRRASKAKNYSGVLGEVLGSQEDDGAWVIKWKISRSCKGAHSLRKLFSMFIKEIVEGMIGYIRLPTIMSKLLSDNGSQEFGDFKITILGMLGTYGFERRILVYIYDLLTWSFEFFLYLFILEFVFFMNFVPDGYELFNLNSQISTNSYFMHFRILPSP